jgi:tetratricopeptide (TPR) repeat protein
VLEAQPNLTKPVDAQGLGRSREINSDSGSAIPQAQGEAAALKSEAVAVARELATAYPADALAYALLGSAYHNTGHSEEATKQLEKCLEINPNQADAYEILGRMAYDKGQLEEAVRLCQQAIQHGPPNPELLNQLGRALMDMGRTEEAIRALQQAVGLPQPVSQSSYLLGQAQLQAGNYAQAKASFQRAVALLPDHTQAYFGLYTVCLRLSQTDEAERYRARFQKLEAIDRQSLTDRSAEQETLSGLPMVRATVARTFFGAGQIYSVHQDGPKAAELFRKAASLDGDNAMYRAALEGYYVQNNALAEGVTVFTQLASAQPDNRLNYLFLGRLHARLGQFEATESAYQKAQKLAPEWAEGYRALAELYLRHNRKVDEARGLARRAVELDPTGAHYYLLAIACAKSGDRPAALEAARQAVAQNPGEKNYRDLLQQINGGP